VPTCRTETGQVQTPTKVLPLASYPMASIRQCLSLARPCEPVQHLQPLQSVYKFVHWTFF
jgi:hypothetical protein